MWYQQYPIQVFNPQSLDVEVDLKCFENVCVVKNVAEDKKARLLIFLYKTAGILSNTS